MSRATTEKPARKPLQVKGTEATEPRKRVRKSAAPKSVQAAAPMEATEEPAPDTSQDMSLAGLVMAGVGSLVLAGVTSLPDGLAGQPDEKAEAKAPARTRKRYRVGTAKASKPVGKPTRASSARARRLARAKAQGPAS